jgi:hypothetical protein
MITALMIAVLLLTALIALSLPWAGFGPGMDAAGRGMAMFFPIILMTLRVSIVCVAVIVLATDGQLDWLGLPRTLAGLLVLALVGGMAALSFAGVSLLCESPRSEGRPQLAFLATIAGPLALVLWMFVERYGATEPAQAWPVRGLVAVMALVPIPMLIRVNRSAAAEHRAAQGEEAQAEAAAEARIAALPAGAALAEILRFHDALDSDDWRSRDKVMQLAAALPDAPAQLTAMLAAPDWETRIAAGIHSSFITPLPEGYFGVVRPIVEEVVRRLQGDAAPPDVLAREAMAAMRLAWPAMHGTNLPQALAAELYAEVVRRGDDPQFRNLQHDMRLLAELVRG